jgi:hypothetical protein
MQATTRYARLQHEFLRQLACRNWWVAGHLAGCAYNVVQYTQIHCAGTAIVREILPRQLLISGKHPYICTYYIATGSPCVPVQIFWSVRGTGKGRKPWHPPAQTTCNIYKILDSGAIIENAVSFNVSLCLLVNQLFNLHCLVGKTATIVLHDQHGICNSSETPSSTPAFIFNWCPAARGHCWNQFGPVKNVVVPTDARHSTSCVSSITTVIGACFGQFGL